MVADVDREDFPDLATLRRRLEERTHERVYLDAEAVALATFGSQPAANLVVVGVAYQRGLLPQSASAIERAIELNGVAVETNTAAFRLGREIAIDPTRADAGPRVAPPALGAEAAALCARVDADAALAEILAWRVPELIAYQDADYAARYVDVVDRARRAELAAGDDASDFARTVARNLYHLMAYKDEYEVARLHAAATYGEKPAFHMSPPLIARFDKATGRRGKIAIPGWLGLPLFRVMQHGKAVRGTVFDPFGYQAERRQEVALIRQYEADLRMVMESLSPATLDTAVALAELPDQIRGFGPVKDANREKAQARRTQLLEALSRPAPLAVAAE
jgi:indolepyruvate ferredoxin oxidoreductase